MYCWHTPVDAGEYAQLNDDKTEFLKFLPQPWHESTTPNSIQIGTENIGLSTNAKNLGVLFDPSLNLSTHISATCKSAFYQLHCLSRIKRYLTVEALKTAVHALISSKLDYCNSLLAGLPKGEIKRLQHVMNSAARLITGTKKAEHITPVLIDLHWLPVEKRIEFKLLCLAYKALHGLAPRYLSDLLTPYVPVRALRSMDQDLVSIPQTRTKKFGQRTFAYVASKLYNELPLSIRQAPSFNSFKTDLKTTLFRRAYYL